MNNQWFTDILEKFATEEKMKEEYLGDKNTVDDIVSEIEQQFEDFLKQKDTPKFKSDILPKDDEKLYDDK